jgi:ZIP family zinc transporter
MLEGRPMLKAVIYGLIASGALLIGAVLAVLLSRPSSGSSGAQTDGGPPRREQIIDRVTKAVMAFGAGVLLCTLAFNLMEEAYKKGGFDHVTLGFLAGALLFLFVDLWLDRLGSGMELMLGALLDGIPESAVIGIGLVATKGLGFVMMIAVFISNFPEGFSGTREMLGHKGARDKTYSRKYTLVMWSAVTAICALSTVVGYKVLSHTSSSWTAFMLAWAAGAILAMVSHTMIPEAFQGVWEVRMHHRGRRFAIGDKIEALAVVAGFLVTFFLTHIAG